MNNETERLVKVLRREYENSKLVVLRRAAEHMRALQAELDTIKAQAEDSTEYVLAQINRELEARLNHETKLTEEARARVTELDYTNAKIYHNNERLRARIAELEKAIEEAPHGHLCAAALLSNRSKVDCNCWKNEILRDD